MKRPSILLSALGIFFYAASPAMAAGDKAPPARDADARENAAAAAPPSMKEGNAPNAGRAKTPEEELATFKVPPGFVVELVASESEGIGKFVPLAFDQKGRLWTTTAFEYPVDGNENPAAADALYAGHGKDKVLVFETPFAPGPQKPRVFADGLAIPLGVLPYGDGCYVLHGHDIAFLHDTDGDGKADRSEVILTGFGVQDSHLFPHQFTRAPGGWIWMAQGAFNYGKVHAASEPAEKAVQFDQTRMARFRPDGSQFTITSNGPCNIWGLVLNGEGECFIQEANDYGYPVMPFHEFANYPGCSNRQWKSYAPEFPVAARDFRMGGTGLSGLALTDAAGPFPEPWRDVMLVANPITNKINAIKMHRDGPGWKLEKLPEFMESSDLWFRPVATAIGPDGCLYVVDWYNKIISHNEVPRNHPDRDKTRGRIWRVKPVGVKLYDVPDFTKASGEELLAKLGGPSLAQSHLAWQALGDRHLTELAPKLREMVLGSGSASGAEIPNVDQPGSREQRAAVPVGTPTLPTPTRLAALWALRGMDAVPEADQLQRLFMEDPDRNIRREALAAMVTVPPSSWFQSGHWKETDPEVRAEMIRRLGEAILREGTGDQIYAMLLAADCEPLPGPLAPGTQSGKLIKVGKAYAREFERYLVRLFLEQRPDQVATFLDRDPARNLPVEARLLASLALEPKASAARVAKLLPQLTRAPGQEEVLRLAQFPEEPGVGEALKAILANPATRLATLDALVAARSRLDVKGKLLPLLTDAATTLLVSGDAASLDLGVKLAGAFQLGGAEAGLVSLVQNGLSETHGTFPGEPGHRSVVELSPAGLQAVKALAELHSDQVDLFERLILVAQQPEVRDAALAALAASKAPQAPERLLALYPKLAPAQRRRALDALAANKAGAKSMVAALTAGVLPKADLEGPQLDKLQVVLGNDPDLGKMMQSLGDLFRPVLLLDGSEEAWTQTKLSFDGPLTIETWIRFTHDIGNADSLGGVPGVLDLNFFGGKLRVWAGATLQDVAISKKPMTTDLWTHIAAVRDDAGLWRLYIDGELDAEAAKPAPGRIENFRIGWSNAKGGTQATFAEYRLWSRARTADEIRRDFDRRLELTAPAGANADSGLVFSNPGGGDWGELRKGAKVGRTSDLPPVLTQAEAAALDEKFAKNRALAAQPGEPKRGEQVAAICMACHLINGKGGNIGPNLSGAGAMGVESLLRNIITPNAAMENGYRIYRVEMNDGSVTDALYVSEDPQALIIRLPGSEDRRIPKSEIRAAKFIRRSLMPEGILEGLEPQQVSDLFAYLLTLK